MNIREAKDFLVNQTAQQAVIGGVPLSDLEKRMMYFSKSDPSCEDPVSLNDAFEAQYDSEEYEPKISLLLHHAYKRVKKESPQIAQQWHQATRELRKGDHYLLVLWGAGSGGARPPYDQLKLLVSAILLACAPVAVFFVLDHFGVQFSRRPRDGRAFKGVQTSAPAWLQRSVLLFMASGYIYFVILPLFIKRPMPEIGRLVGGFLRHVSEGSGGTSALL
jgi:hypothetical protein